MSYLPIIRFNTEGQLFNLNLHYPHSVNGKIITCTHLGHTGDACYIIDQELNRYYLPYNYAEIINDALKLHSNIYHEFVTDSRIHQIITEFENIDRYGYDRNNLELLNHVLERQIRNGSYLHDRIFYDTTYNKVSVFDCNGVIIRAVYLNQRFTPPSTQRGRRAEVTSTFLTADEIARANNRSELDDRERTVHAYDGYRHHGFSTGHPVNESISDREYHHDFYDMKVKKTYIHSFNYVPEYIKHFMPGESEDTTLLLGAEIEVGGNNNIPSDNDKNSTVKKCIQIMNGSDSDEENLIYSTHDSTVQIEFDTMPCSLEFHKNKMNYREMFEYLDKEGYKGHDCKTAGLHIHANRSYLGKSRISQELVISKILYILEKFNDEICVIARRDNDYSEFAGEKQNEDSIVELYGKYKEKGKRAALNLQHKDTIEFRMFKSTLKYETFILTLEFVKDIIDYAKSVDIEEIELAKWSDLMNCFSTELREYYEFRYQKKVKDISGLATKQIRKRISKLKSELKNSMNFFQKTKLQQEISNLEKAYKELNKKEKKITKMKLRIAESETIFSVPMYATSIDSYSAISMRNIRI